jgi:hypothetical protein
MRSGTPFWLAATITILGLGVENPASAWEGWGRYSPAYYGPPVYITSPPAIVYPGPPVYSYSYLSARPLGGVLYSGSYTARINPFRGPRWDYSAAYYSSPPVRRAVYGRHAGRSGGSRFCPRCRAYVRGPIVPILQLR